MTLEGSDPPSRRRRFGGLGVGETPSSLWSGPVHPTTIFTLELEGDHSVTPVVSFVEVGSVSHWRRPERGVVLSPSP